MGPPLPRFPVPRPGTSYDVRRISALPCLTTMFHADAMFWVSPPNGCVNIHDPLRERNASMRGIANEGRSRGIRPCQSGLVDVHHQRVARCPGAAGSLETGIEQKMVAFVAVISHRRELHDGARIYGIHIGFRASILVVVVLLDVLQPSRS